MNAVTTNFRPHECGHYELATLAVWCQRFSPIVGIETADKPQSLLLDVTGIGPLFGGEAALAEKAATDLRQRGCPARVAIADTIRATWAMARFGFEEHTVVPPGGDLAALDPLPPQALQLPEETVRLLRELGVVEIGQLRRLPRSALAARFGRGLITRLDQAAGRVAEVIVAHHPAPHFEAAWALEFPTARRELLESVVGQLVVQVSAQLAQHGRGALEIECSLRCTGGETASARVGLFLPADCPEYLQGLIRLQWEGLSLPGEVDHVRLAVTQSDLIRRRQRELFPDQARRHAGELAALIDRLTGRLGREQVVRAGLLPGAQPEGAYRFTPLTGPRRRPGKAAAPLPLERPLRLFSPPAPVRAVSLTPGGPPAAFDYQATPHRVARHWGPERIETAWWRGRSIRRDYYRIETQTGARWWLFCRLQDDRWFVHGEFA